LISSRRLDASPARIRLHQSNQLERIRAPQKATPNGIDLGKQPVLERLRAGNLPPLRCRVQSVDLRCGISRSLIAKEGIAAAPKNILKFARLGGLSALIQIHTHLVLPG